MTQDQGPSEVNEEPVGFDEVLLAELAAITDRRGRYEQAAPSANDLSGLAISGGGIRVATFALGALQAMATVDLATDSDEKEVDESVNPRATGLLGAFDYLSTVSGGGFVGGWLTSWIQRSSGAKADGPSGLANVASSLRQSVADSRIEATQLHHLRRFSNYLTPERGIFSLDTWTAASIYTRNLLLNLLNVVAMMLAGIILVFIGIKAFGGLFEFDTVGSSGQKIVYVKPSVYWLLFALTAVFSMCAYCRALKHVGRSHGITGSAKNMRMTPTVILFWGVAIAVLPLLAAKYFVPWPLSLLSPAEDDWLNGGLRVAIIGAVLHGLPGVMCLTRTSQPLKGRVWSTGCAIVGGGLAGAVGGVVLALLFFNLFPNPLSKPDIFAIFGPPTVLLTVVVGIAVEVGFLSRSASTHEREWWARLAAWLSVTSFGWMAITGIAFYSGPAFEWMGWRIQLFLGTSALVVATLAARIGSSASTRHEAPSAFSGLIVRLGPALFILTLAVGMSSLVRGVVLRPGAPPKGFSLSQAQKATAGDRLDLWEATETFVEGEEPKRSFTRVREVYPSVFKNGVSRTRTRLLGTNKDGLPKTSFSALGWCMVIPLIVAVFLAVRFDINVNSLSGAWANRIIRCYLGASNPDRVPHPHTGFDPHDDIPLTLLRADVPATRVRPVHPLWSMWLGFVFGLPVSRPDTQIRRTDYDGPIHLINGALNIYKSDDLARQERRAESFVMSPYFCGYTLAATRTKKSKQKTLDCYTPTDQYAGQLTLGSAISISGAAATPNMGYHTMPSLAALMTVLNVRLGWWLPNPSSQKPNVLRSRSPKTGLSYLANELLSRTSASTNYVYVSDGGHFENLAAYELIRRRVRFIVLIDGEADPKYQFHGLGSLVRKARVDFGVDISISPHAIIPTGVAKIRSNNADTEVLLEDRLSELNYALGLIEYPLLKKETGTDCPEGEAKAGTDSGDDEARTNRMGLLIYVKSSMVAEHALHEADLRQYATTNDTFPHESTADQFFSESQFESYRLLGERVMTSVLQEVLNTAATSTQAAAKETEWLEDRSDCSGVRALNHLAERAVDSKQRSDSEEAKVDESGAPTQECELFMADIAPRRQQLERLIAEFRKHCSRYRYSK